MTPVNKLLPRSETPLPTRRTVRRPTLTLLLLSLVSAPVCFGEDRPTIETLEAQTAFPNNTVSEPTPNETSYDEPADTSSTFNDWSPLIVIALGIMGLILVRRHATDL